MTSPTISRALIMPPQALACHDDFKVVFSGVKPGNESKIVAVGRTSPSKSDADFLQRAQREGIPEMIANAERRIALARQRDIQKFGSPIPEFWYRTDFLGPEYQYRGGASFRVASTSGPLISLITFLISAVGNEGDRHTFEYYHSLFTPGGNRDLRPLLAAFLETLVPPTDQPAQGNE